MIVIVMLKKIGKSAAQREVRLTLHQVLAGKLCLNIHILGNTIKLSNLCFSSSGVTHTLERVLYLDLGLAITEIKTKYYRSKKINKNVKDVGMACQKVCKQDRDNA